MEPHFLRPSDALSETDGVESGPSPDDEIISQLSEKIRQQAKRLTGLERYKQLCEERIRELDPAHTLPVTSNHLGLKAKDTAAQQLHLAHQKILRLEHQLAQSHVQYSDRVRAPPIPTSKKSTDHYSDAHYKLHTTLKDKAALEDTLRSEMLLSEEQRTYIEVLKQALEAKMQGHRVTTPVSRNTFSNMLASTSRSQASLKETTKLQNVFSDHDAQLKRVTAKLAKRADEVAALLEENDHLTSENLRLSQTTETLTQELDKLSTEKDTLLDYVDQHNREMIELKDEIELTKRDYDALSDGHGAVKAELDGLKAHLNEVEEEAETSRLRLDEQDVTINLMKEQETQLESQFQNTLTQLTASRSSQHETQSKLDETIKQRAEMADQLQHLTEEKLELQVSLQKATLDLQNYREEVCRVEDAFAALTEQHTSAQSQYEDTVNTFIERIELEKTKATELSQILEERDRNADDLKRQAEQYAKASIELNAKLENAQIELVALTSRCQDQDMELSQSKIRYTEAADRLRLTLSQLEEAQSRLISVETKLRSCQSTLRQVEEQKQQHKLEILELTQLLDNSREVCIEQSRRLEAYGDENSMTRRSLNDIENEADELAASNDKLRELNEHLQLSERSLQTNLAYKEGELLRLKALYDDLAVGITQSLTALIGRAKGPHAKELVRKWESRVAGIDGVLEWIRNSQAICNASILQSEQFETELQLALDRESTITQHLDDLQVNELLLRERERDFRSQVEQLIYQRDLTEALRINLEREVSALNQEVQQLRKDQGMVTDELTRLRSQSGDSQFELSSWRAALKNDSTALRSCEERLSITLMEKKSLEVLLTRLQRTLPTSELQRVFSDLVVSQCDLNTAERERSKIEGRLNELEALEPSQETGEETSTLIVALARSKDQVNQHLRKLSALEKELDLLEAAERKLRLGSLDTERIYGSVKEEGGPKSDRSPKLGYQRKY